MMVKRPYVIHDALLGDITYNCPPKCCLFCDKCTDVFYDYTSGPYMMLCTDPRTTTEIMQAGYRGECEFFVEE